MPANLTAHQNALKPFGLNRSNATLMIASAICYAILLTLTLSGASLWTDEAFSAYMASHKTVGLFFSTLVGGDSSDLQAVMYYFYLFVWTSVCGTSEFAFRAANIPFILVFAFALVWISWRVFHSKWGWIVPGCLPFLWSYASDVRAYFALVAFGTLCFGGLLIYFEDPSARERRYLPWLVLGSLFLGTTFHMLMLLAVVPMLIIIFTYGRSRGFMSIVEDWMPAVKVLVVPFVLLALYLAWTFGRGTAYDYDQPGLLSMGSVIYRFLGLSGFGPNRRYDIPFRPYLLDIGLAGLALGIAAAVITQAALRTNQRLRYLCLAGALVMALLQVVVLSVVARQQVDVRHLAALTPLLMFLPLTVSQLNARASRAVLASLFVIAAVWFIADCRLLFLPEYQSEDFRSAIHKAVALYKQSKADIAVVADPPASAYYGLELEGPRPCFPLLDTCTAGFAKVTWIRNTPAYYATPWTGPQIQQWLDQHKTSGVPVVVVISRTRHPMYKNSAWWPALSKAHTVLYPVHGFFVYFVK